MIPPAETTRAAYNACHPDKPLLPDDKRYEDLSSARGNQDFVESLAVAIDWSQDDAPPYHKRLFTGHRGCGKTTELLRLKQKLEKLGFFVIYIDVEQQLDLEDIEYADLLLSMMMGLFKAAKEHQLPLSEKLLTAIQDWFAQRVLTETDYEQVDGNLKAQIKAGAVIPFISDFFASLVSQIQIGTSQKTEIRKVLERDLNVFKDRLNLLISEVRKQIQKKSWRDLVLIADGLEKMPFKVMSKQTLERVSDTQETIETAGAKSNHEMLFVDNAKRLEMPECHLIYTVPISLAYNANLGNAFGDDYVAVMPMVKLPSENYAQNSHMTLFRSLIAKRIDVDAVFDSPEVLDELIIVSGGAVRDLMRLIRIACQGTQSVSFDDVERAKRVFMTEYDRLLRWDDFEILKQVHETKQVTADDKYARLLHLRVLHEYMNGKRWVDVHPLVLCIERVERHLS